MEENMSKITTFESFFEIATKHSPYPYQTQIAKDGLPELLCAETGAGKTDTVIVGWLWRRFCHEDLSVRLSTPRWLVICEPMRSLTEQVFNNANGWVNRLIQSDVIGTDSIGVHMLMGGKDHRKEQEILRRYPDRPAITVGTLEMLLSRALNRGYAMSRFIWPIDFGLFNNGAHWVFDEVQLMGAALQTSRQLEGFRNRFGTILPTSSTWMSATVNPESMKTVDNPIVDEKRIVRLSDGDRNDPNLKIRLAATKTVKRLEVGSGDERAVQIASALIENHQSGTLTLALLNTVTDAQAVFRELNRNLSSINSRPKTVLLHSRFRPDDREKHLKTALSKVNPDEPGMIIVSTQVVEAGVDISASLLLTDVAPWPSMVQRAGRCNRDGKASDAHFIWMTPDKKSKGPYDPKDIERAVMELEQLEGVEVTARSMTERKVELEKVVTPVIRAIDLLGLFDTAPDISGNDIDISPFIRDGDDLNLYFAWVELDSALPRKKRPLPEELCPVPLNKQLKEFIENNSKRVLRFDHIEGEWVKVKESELRPGLILLVNSTCGGYDVDIGWDPGSQRAVPPIFSDVKEKGNAEDIDKQGLERRVTPPEDVEENGDAENIDQTDDSMAGDPLSSLNGRWVELSEHLGDVERSVAQIALGFGEGLLPEHLVNASVQSGRLHDPGKAHRIFQDCIVKCAKEEDRAYREANGPWAKSGIKKRLEYERKFFRHELASALMLLSDGEVALRGTDESDLIIYLVAAHHGRVRLGIRSMPDEESKGYVLGIKDGDKVPSVAIPNGEIPPTTLSLETMKLGRSESGVASWSERMIALRDREDLGPFRLGFLEALVRCADWRASREEEEQVQPGKTASEVEK